MDSRSFVNRVIGSCGSTNDLARVLGERGYPHGTWVSARSQEKGRGRIGREWKSEEGNLFLSLVARPGSKQHWTWVPLTAAVAVESALRRRFPEVSVRIKWPNDLWVQEAKLGGILCEGVGAREGAFIVIGIGLNCAHHPSDIDQAATSVSSELGRAATADEIRDEVIDSLLSWLATLDREGPAPICEAYERVAALPKGTEVRWGESGSGRVLGLGPNGELRVELPDGSAQNLYAEDVRVRPVL